MIEFLSERWVVIVGGLILVGLADILIRLLTDPRLAISGRRQIGGQKPLYVFHIQNLSDRHLRSRVRLSFMATGGRLAVDLAADDVEGAGSNPITHQAAPPAEAGDRPNELEGWLGPAHETLLHRHRLVKVDGAYTLEVDFRGLRPLKAYSFQIPVSAGTASVEMRVRVTRPSRLGWLRETQFDAEPGADAYQDHVRVWDQPAGGRRQGAEPSIWVLWLALASALVGYFALTDLLFAFGEPTGSAASRNGWVDLIVLSLMAIAITTAFFLLARRKATPIAQGYSKKSKGLDLAKREQVYSAPPEVPRHKEHVEKWPV